MKPICVSVIVPAYNASATIGKTLQALSRQDYTQGFEVIVVDDGSVDDTAGIVSSFPAVRLVRQENAGPASARNHGAGLAQGEYLAFTDSDCIPHEDWISNLMHGFSENEGVTTSRKVGVVAGSYGIVNPQSLLARCVYKEILWRHHHLMPDFPNSFGSYNFCVKKGVFNVVGGFNTRYRQASGEDNDLSYKIVKAGWQIYFQRKALVDHYHPTFVLKYLKEQYRHGFWRVVMYTHHPQMMKGDGYTFWKDIIEPPWVACILAGAIMGFFHGFSPGWPILFLLLLLLLFEGFFAIYITKYFFEGIFFGFVIFFRAFARMFGLLTGTLSLFFEKIVKIIH